MPEVPSRKFYANPPVIERAISVHGAIDLERYEKAFASWEERIKSAFPDHETISQWTLNIKHDPKEGGLPVFDPNLAEVSVQHRFWRHNKAGKRAWCLQVRSDRLVVNLVRHGDDGHKFEELSSVLAEWLPRWNEHFQVEKIPGTQVEYVNVLSARVTPQFIEPGGGINVGKAFRLFSNVPMAHEGVIPPYDCKMTVVCDKKMPCYLFIHLFGSQDGNSPAVQIRFRGSTSSPQKSLTLDKTFEEVSFAHMKIVEAFEQLFTPEAKTSFKPT